MTQVAVVEFNGVWDEEAIQECLNMMGKFKHSVNQGMRVSVLDETGASRVIGVLYENDVLYESEVQ